ncbi:hypothetical protein WAI453_004696 [Rhynchosporium graminicola]
MLTGSTRDVIDYEQASGDIYKMLLGSLVENYDGRDNLCELVESLEEAQDSIGFGAPQVTSSSRSIHGNQQWSSSQSKDHGYPTQSSR